MNFSNISYKTIKHPALYVLLFFGATYVLTSIVNHYNFRTHGFDLGIYNKVLYDYAHFKPGINTLYNFSSGDSYMNILGDHLEFIPVLVAPLYYVFGNYTLLIVQIAAILFGAIGVYRLVKEDSGNSYFATGIMAFFLSLWGINSALSFDYHNNVVGTMFVPWLFLYWKKENWNKFTIFYFLIVTSKENMALWMVSILIGMIIMKWLKDGISFEHIKKEVGFVIVASIYFVVALKLIIPSFNSGDYMHFKFNALGKDMTDVVRTILTHPQRAFELLFESHHKGVESFGIKSELHFVVLLSGGVMLIYRPYWLLMLLPIYFQKLWNDDYARWGINYQYSIEFVPIITLAVYDVVSNSVNKRYRYSVLIVVFVMSFMTNLVTLNSRTSVWYNKAEGSWSSSKHYEVPYDIDEINTVLDMIPSNARLSAHARLLPHVADRDRIYQFPNIDDAEYIVYTLNLPVWLMKKDMFIEKRLELETSKQWEIIKKTPDVILLKKILL